MAPKWSRRRLLGVGLRLAASVLVVVLFAVLVDRILTGNPGAHLTRAISAHRAPLAPNVELHVIWNRTGTWPERLRQAGADGTLQLADLRGYPVVLNFWASWCSPCQREADLLASTAEASRGRVVFVGVDVNDLTNDARHFLAAKHVPYVAVHSGSSTADRFGLIGLPETFYLDRGGRIRDVTRGQVSAATLQRELVGVERG